MSIGKWFIAFCNAVAIAREAEARRRMKMYWNENYDKKITQ